VIAPLATPRGWCAELRLGFAPRAGATRLVERRQRGPLVVQRPFLPGDGSCHCYLLHPPGGVVGGDELTIEVDAAPASAVLLTTPGATKFYRSAGAWARVTQRLSVAAGASLEWLPQENILFPGAQLQMGTTLALAEGARFIGWEILCAGRPAAQEQFTQGQAQIGLRIERAGRVLLRERLRLDATLLAAATGLRGHPASATLVVTPADPAALALARAALGPTPAEVAAATLVDGLLLVRWLGQDAEAARRCLLPVWEALRPAIIGLPALRPRIWST